MRKYFLAGMLFLGSIGLAVSSASAQSAGGCHLQGTASFSPGLNSSSQPFSYSFGGTLTGCQSSQSGTPTSGTVSAGQTLVESVHNSVTGATDQVTYQEPKPSGTGSCATSTTGGETLVTWADGTNTVESYTTTGAAAAVQLTGSVAPSMTLTAVNAASGDPTTYTVNTTRYAGDASNGLLTFQPPDPTACNTSGGVTTAGIGGAVTLSGS